MNTASGRAATGMRKVGARLLPRAASAANGIRNLADAANHSPWRTPADAAYLTALYQVDPEERQLAAQSDIAGRMTKMFLATKEASR